MISLLFNTACDTWSADPLVSKVLIPSQTTTPDNYYFDSDVKFICYSGYLVSLKVSPNCRIPTKATKKNIYIEPKQLEVMKLERVLSFVREPTALKVPLDMDNKTNSADR